MRSISITFRPIERWPKPMTRFRQRSRFKASYSQTLDLLDRELWHVGAKQVVLQMALQPSDIRVDGLPRASAKPSHPGVILAFQTKRGPLSFPCDTYDRYEDNLRAIALSLEALRSVDRYGVTGNGEQYRGWERLPPPETHEGWTLEQAQAFIDQVNDGQADWSIRVHAENAIRRAEMKTHPDIQGGDAEKFKLVQHARIVILKSWQRQEVE